MKVTIHDQKATPQESIVEKQVKERLAEVAPSPARLRMQQLTKKHPTLATKQARIEQIELETGDWFVRRMNFGEYTRFGLLCGRDENGVLNIDEAENLTNLTAAMLFCCVASDDTGDEDFFGGFGEAYEWAAETEATIRNAVGELFTHILALNPDIIPEADAEQPPTPEQTDALKKKARTPGKARARKNSP